MHHSPSTVSGMLLLMPHCLVITSLPDLTDKGPGGITQPHQQEQHSSKPSVSVSVMLAVQGCDLVRAIPGPCRLFARALRVSQLLAAVRGCADVSALDNASSH